MRRAALIQFGSKYVSMGCQLLITAILARLISPEDFGLLAMVSVFTAFFTLFSDMGIGVAIVQFRDLDERDFGSLFFFSLLLSVGLAVIFCASSPFLAAFYGEEELIPLCIASSFSLVFSTLNMVPNGLMLRERRFNAIGLRLIVATIVSGSAAIIAALMGAGVYALVFQTVASSMIVFFWNFLSRPIEYINVHFIAPLRTVFSYSVYQFGFGLINYFSRNLDKLLIGKSFGTVDVGNYDKAYKLTGYPLSAFSSVIASVIQPFMAEHQDEPEVIFSYWLRIEKALSLVGAAIAAIFVCCSAEIIELFYGSQWGAAVPVFAALSASVYVQVLWNPSGAFFQSLGRTDLMFKSGLINTAITIAGLVLGLIGGSISSVAVCVSVAYSLHTVPLYWYLLRGCFQVGPRVLLRFLPEVLIGGLSVILVNSLSSFVPQLTLAAFVLKLFICSGILLLGYAITGQLRHLKVLIKK